MSASEETQTRVKLKDTCTEMFNMATERKIVIIKADELSSSAVDEDRKVCAAFFLNYAGTYFVFTISSKDPQTAGEVLP